MTPAYCLILAGVISEVEGLTDSSRHATCKLYTTKTAVTDTDILNDRVVLDLIDAIKKWMCPIKF